MASGATTKAARKAAREATIAAQEAVAARSRANMDDLTVFFSARHRADVGLTAICGTVLCVARGCG